MSVGVVIGRFQVAALHEGHVALLSAVQAKHPRLVVLVGTNKHKVADSVDPLPFFCRHDAIRAVFPQATVMPVYDMKDDHEWSQQVDTALDGLGPIVIYGGRDNSLDSYSGRWPKINLDLQIEVSGDQVRKATELGYSQDFRTGMIYQTQLRYPVSYQAVDIAVMDLGGDKHNVLLGRKRGETLYRFPGGFVDPPDVSLEAAAMRELREECGDMQVTSPVYIGSTHINDWRYRKSVDSIKSAMFVTGLIWGAPRAGDDLHDVAWHDTRNLDAIRAVLNPSHAPLLELLEKYLQRK